MMARSIPIEARMREKMLVTPPRMLGAKERRKPNTPKMIAIIASASPVPGLTQRLAMAAPMAMIEGILKWGLFCAIEACIFEPLLTVIFVLTYCSIPGTENRRST
jgi:hypothetical protein